MKVRRFTLALRLVSGREACGTLAQGLAQFMAQAPAWLRAAFAMLFALAAAQALPQVPAPAAGQTAYNIELIVFAASAGPAQREDWTAGGARLARGGETGEAPAGGAQVGRFVGPLPASQFQLNDLQTRLVASGAWRTVAHVAWSQSASSWGSRAGFTLSQLGLRAPGLSGTVFLERGTFLHLGMALKYATGDGRIYDLSETRRVKFYDKNYYDHPAFGVIALVTPAVGGRAPGR